MKSELTLVTEKLLYEIGEIKKNIISAQMRGETSIIRGIDFFAKIIEKINPNTIDADMVNEIEKKVLGLLREGEEYKQSIDSYMNYGIERCFLLLEGYERIEKKKRIKGLQTK